jgi:enoyl-CoA hydratase
MRQTGRKRRTPEQNETSSEDAVTGYANFKSISFENRDGVGVLTLNRPDHMNAFTHEMHVEFEDVMLEISEDKRVRAVVLTGAGRAFCAGGDLEEMKNPQTRKAPRVMDSSRRLPHAMLAVKQPIICAVNGHAVGIGATIALFCDVVFMAEAAKIGDPHVKVGLVAGDGGAVIWPLLIGINRAKELLLTGDLVTASEAYRIGLANRVLPAEKVLPAAMELAERLARGPALAIQWTKLAINRALRTQTENVLDTSLALEGITIVSRDHQEGIAAFLEKRPPRFEGL